MPIDKAELATELEKNHEILTVTVEALQKKGYSIYDKEKHSAFIESTRKDAVDKAIPDEIKKVHDAYDKDIEDLFGVKKDNNEKSYEYLKRGAKAKITTLEKAIAEKGDPTGELQKKIEGLEQKAAKAIQDRDTQINALKTENDKAVKGMHMQSVYGELSKNFKKQLPDMFDELRDAVLEKASANAILKDGKLYLGDGTGAIKKNDSTFKEITMEDHLKEKFKSVIDVERSAAGAGSGKGGGKGNETPDPKLITKETFVLSDTVKNRQDLMGQMLGLGMARGSDNFNAIWNKYALGVEIVAENGKKVEKKIGDGLPL